MMHAASGAWLCDHCAAEAVVVAPGLEEVSTALGLILAEGQPMRCWCLDCAHLAGWPWLESEAAKRKRIPK